MYIRCVRYCLITKGQMILKKLYKNLIFFLNNQVQVICVVRDSSVGIAIHYELEGPRIESRWGEILRTRPDPASFKMGTESVSRVKRPGRGLNHPPLLALRKSSAIPLLPLWVFVACSRVKFTLQVICCRSNSRLMMNTFGT